MSQPTSTEFTQLTAAIRSLELSLKQQSLLLRASGVGIDVSQPRSSRASFNKGQPPLEFNTNEQRSATKRDKVAVYIRVVFLKVGEIDTLKQKYSADVFIQAKWRDQGLDNKTAKDVDEVDWETMWNPKLFVENVYGEDHTESVWHTVVFDQNGRATVTEKRRISGSFLEYLELNQFPFDIQDLTITVSSELSEAVLELQEDRAEVSGINVQSFVDEQEWYLHSHVETWRKVTTKVYHNTKYKHSALSAACKASRRPGFFVWNIFFVMMFICSLSFSTFAVKVDLPQNRLQLSFILLLTTVTFKFIVNQSLPRISYLTYLDKYILTSMSILCFICIWHAIIPLILEHTSENSARFADRLALAVFAATYVAFHIFFVIWVVFIAKKKSVRIVQKDEQQKERLNILDQDPGTIDWTKSKVSLKSITDPDDSAQAPVSMDKKMTASRRILPLREESV